jgi:hypothetical protein
MNDPFPYPETPLDRAVRARLDAEAQGVKTEQLLAGVRQRLAADSVVPARGRRRWILAAAGVLAASVLVTAFLLIPGGSIQASPRQVVERARATHQRPTDRCYAVRVEMPPDVRKQFPRFDFDRESRIWTRGDRYFVELPNGHGVWGRDEMKRVWFVPSPDGGARFDDSEVPAVFREFLSIRAVNLAELLDEVLAECDLSWASNVDVPDDLRRVYAVSREPARSLRGAVIDVEKGTNTVRRLALDRQMFRDPRSKASVIFTLVDTSPQPIERYSAEGHLNAGAPIYDGNQPGARLRLLSRHVGPFKQD